MVRRGSVTETNTGIFLCVLGHLHTHIFLKGNIRHNYFTFSYSRTVLTTLEEVKITKLKVIKWIINNLYCFKRLNATFYRTNAGQ